MNDRPSGRGGSGFRGNHRSDNRDQRGSGRPFPPPGPRGGRDGRHGGGPGRGPARDRHDRPQQDRNGPDIEILHLEEHLVVIKKPVGVQTAAVRSRRATALDLTREALRRKRERNLRVFPVHEIDRDASGVLVFARTDEATLALRKQFRSRATDRVYLALLEAELSPDTPPTTIRSRLIENARGVGQSINDYEAAPAGPDKPRAAVTHVRVMASREGLTLVRLRAETDHPYQLRAHMSEAGTPVAGDRAYRSVREDIPRVALHLAEVSFEHPLTGMKEKFSSPAPVPFYELVGKTPPRGAKPAKTVTAEGKEQPTHWDNVSEWYNDLIGGKGNDLYEQVLIPGTVDLLTDAVGELSEKRILDIACGQGVLSRALAERGAAVRGFDAAPGLIEKAREQGDSDGKIEYLVGDARNAAEVVVDTRFNAATCLMALMNIDDLDAAFRGASDALEDDGVFVAVMLHPAFRSPRQTAWGWMGDRAETQRQFRRVDAYMSASSVEITMNPGAASEGKETVTTTTFHRPISAVVRSAAEAGFAIDRLDEWASPRESEPGPRADEENRARREIPMFLAIRARKLGNG